MSSGCPSDDREHRRREVQLLQRIDDTEQQEQFSRMLSKRKQVVQELVETEKNFVGSLEVLSKCYIESFPTVFALLSPQAQSHAALLKPLVPTLAVLLNFHRVLYRELDVRVGGSSGTEQFDPARTLLSEVFVKVLPALKAAHTRFVQTFSPASAAIRTLYATSKDFSAWAAVRRRSSCTGLDLLDLLIMPVQRVPRYALLVTELIKNTPSTHPDAKGLRSTIEAISETASYINQQQAKLEQMDCVTSALLSIRGLRVGSDVTKINTQRRLIREGDIFDEVLDRTASTVERQSQQRLFLFSDLLVWSTLTAPANGGNDHDGHVSMSISKKMKRRPTTHEVADQDHDAPKRYDLLRMFYLEHITLDSAEIDSQRHIILRVDRPQSPAEKAVTIESGQRWIRRVAAGVVATISLRGQTDADTGSWLEAIQKCKSELEERRLAKNEKIRARMTFVDLEDKAMNDAIDRARRHTVGSSVVNPLSANGAAMGSFFLGDHRLQDSRGSRASPLRTRLATDASLRRKSFFVLDSHGTETRCLWPLKTPTVDAIVAAGFMFWPSSHSKDSGGSGASSSSVSRQGAKKVVKTDRVRCVTCKKVCFNWLETDDPLTLHRQLSPDCSFVQEQVPAAMPQPVQPSEAAARNQAKKTSKVNRRAGTDTGLPHSGDYTMRPSARPAANN